MVLKRKIIKIYSLVLFLPIFILSSCSDNKSMSNFSKRKYLERFVKNKSHEKDVLYASKEISLNNSSLKNNKTDTIVMSDGEVINCKIKRLGLNTIRYRKIEQKKDGQYKMANFRVMAINKDVVYYVYNGKRYDEMKNTLFYPNPAHKNHTSRQLDTIVEIGGDTIVGNVYRVKNDRLYFTQKVLRNGEYTKDIKKISKLQSLSHLKIDGKSYIRTELKNKTQLTKQRINPFVLAGFLFIFPGGLLIFPILASVPLTIIGITQISLNPNKYKTTHGLIAFNILIGGLFSVFLIGLMVGWISFV